MRKGGKENKTLHKKEKEKEKSKIIPYIFMGNR